MSEMAIAGTLAGVIVGSVLTGVIQYLQRRRGERLEVRAAARALYHDAFDTLYLLGGALRRLDEGAGAETTEVRDAYDAYRETQEMWRQHRRVFRRDLSDGEWEDLENAFLSEKPGNLEERRARGIRAAEAVAGDIRDLETAFEVLEALAYGRRVTRRVRREQRLMEDASGKPPPPYRWARRLAARRFRRRVIALSGRFAGASGD